MTRGFQIVMTQSQDAGSMLRVQALMVRAMLGSRSLGQGARALCSQVVSFRNLR
jgi:hypothetical protein